ncbi:hypothetical protein PspLS_06358 [Pyricularia sp. CBS 133598]|nr:hypothetical protein PspLS_06358 [Pyricularia sp. CBS 133598]
MKYLSLIVAASSVLPSLTSAHYLFPQAILNGQKTKEFEFVREHENAFYPSWDKGNILKSNDLRCNKGSEKHASKTKALKVVAGQDVVGFATNIGQRFGHPGPLTIMMSKAPGDVKDYMGEGNWFTVYQLTTTTPWNGTDQGWLSWNKNQFTFKLPLEIPKGQYLMRIEHMAVHPPNKGKEFYMQCAHLDVQSDYNGSPPGPTYKIPGGLNMKSPAIELDSWAEKKTLTVAPRPWSDKLWPNDDQFNKII